MSPCAQTVHAIACRIQRRGKINFVTSLPPSHNYTAEFTLSQSWNHDSPSSIKKGKELNDFLTLKSGDLTQFLYQVSVVPYCALVPAS